MEAAWISPKGMVYEVDSRHIHSIITNPEIFGFTKAWIKSVYRKYREPVGQEGNAREHILIKLMEKGWIRIRHVKKQYSVTIQLSDLYYKDGSWKEIVSQLTKTAVKECGLPETVSVVIIDLSGGLLFPEKQLYELAGGALHERQKRGTFADFLNPFVKRRYYRRKK